MFMVLRGFFAQSWMYTCIEGCRTGCVDENERAVMTFCEERYKSRLGY